VTKKYESDKLVIPEHVKSKNDKADFRKLPEDVQEQVDGAELLKDSRQYIEERLRRKYPWLAKLEKIFPFWMAKR